MASEPLRYLWCDLPHQFACELAHIPGTGATPYLFQAHRPVAIADFFLATTPLTQALCAHVLSQEANPSLHRDATLPLENISWNSITGQDGLLDRFNRSPLREHFATLSGLPNATFRLPSETEWEYAARGGPHWRDGFHFSGGNDIEAVAWYDRRHGDHTQPVALRQPNQLGLYDMSGNVWEWCQDRFTTAIDDIPLDGSPFLGEGEERVLRGGCFHNWAVHCTVSKRYAIGQQFHDGCIGLRLAFSP